MVTLTKIEPKRRRRREGDATRSSILDAAEALFVKKGFAATSMADIASRAAVSKSLIHHHFGSKKGLWQEVTRRRLQELAKILREVMAAGEPDAELIAESMRGYFRFLQSNLSFVRLSAWMNLEDPDLSIPTDPGLIIRELEEISDAQASGELRDDIKAFSVFMALVSICTYWFLARNAFDHDLHTDSDPNVADEEYLSDVMKIFLDGVRARPAEGEKGRKSGV